MRASPIRVLVVDDSAFARKVVREVLSRDPEIEVVGYARDGLEALEKIVELKPDVVTLDLLMPELDGVGVLRALPQSNPPKVIIVSVANSEADLAIEALQNGAVDLVSKPTPHPTDRLYELSTELIEKVKMVALAHPRLISSADVTREAETVAGLSLTPAAQGRLVVIGTSTGGPQALTEIFRSLPARLPVPLAIALHIPAGYTAPLAARLTRASAVPVEEATDGMELKPGRAVIAPGGMHLRIKSIGNKFYASISHDPVDMLYHPSVDILFESAAECAGSGAIGVILTGMGNDGTDGATALRAIGAQVLTESASSCVVYGMPRSVSEAGLSNAEAPLEKMSELIVDYIYRDRSESSLIRF